MMKSFFVVVALFCFSNASAQYWSKLFDSTPGGLDAILYVDATNDQVITLGYSLDLAEAKGGFSFKRLHRKDGRILAEAKFYFQDSVCELGAAIRITDNKYALLYNTSFWAFTTAGYYFLHYVDSMGVTISKHRLSSYDHSSVMRGAALTESGFLLISVILPPGVTANSYMEYVGFEGQARWSQTVVPMSTRYFDGVMTVGDTLVLLQNSGSGPRIFLFDTLGNELARSDIPGHETYFAVNFSMSRDSTRYLLAGIVGPQYGNPQAVMVIDRGLNKIDYKAWNIGNLGVGRDIVENRFGDYLFVGHTTETLIANRQNGFVMRIDPDGLTQEALYYYSTNGDLSSNRLQLFLKADIQDSILYIAGHGGITDTTGSQDEWIMALTDLGSCDTADCYPWLVSGLEGVPAAWMEAWSIGTGMDAWYVRLDRPDLYQKDAKLSVFGMQGRQWTTLPVSGPETRIPFDAMPAGHYIIQWQSGARKMFQRALRP